MNVRKNKRILVEKIHRMVMGRRKEFCVLVCSSFVFDFFLRTCHASRSGRIINAAWGRFDCGYGMCSPQTIIEIQNFVDSRTFHGKTLVKNPIQIGIRFTTNMVGSFHPQHIYDLHYNIFRFLIFLWKITITPA